jgi:hypothetical protein
VSGMNQSDENIGKAGGIQVIARAASIMRALGSHPHGLSLAAIRPHYNRSHIYVPWPKKRMRQRC